MGLSCGTQMKGESENGRKGKGVRGCPRCRMGVLPGRIGSTHPTGMPFPGEPRTCHGIPLLPGDEARDRREASQRDRCRIRRDLRIQLRRHLLPSAGRFANLRLSIDVQVGWHLSQGLSLIRL